MAKHQTPTSKKLILLVIIAIAGVTSITSAILLNKPGTSDPPTSKVPTD